MPYFDPSTTAMIEWLKWGARCDYAAYAATNTPQGTTLDLWTVSGIVSVQLILAEVSTVLEAAANNTKYVAHPATGTDVDLCAVLDTTGIEVGGKLVVIGTFATALTKGNAGAVQGLNISPIIVGNTTYATTIRMDCAGSRTGKLKHAIWWLPLTDGASVVSAA